MAFSRVKYLWKNAHRAHRLQRCTRVELLVKLPLVCDKVLPAVNVAEVDVHVDMRHDVCAVGFKPRHLEMDATSLLAGR
jgi:hypothetical protein